MTPYIKDLQSGNIRPYGSNHHDSLMISQDGTYLTYEHLQCGGGSIAGDKKHSDFVFCDDEGHTPEEDEILCRYGADAYFNIGGWGNTIDILDKIRAEIKAMFPPSGSWMYEEGHEVEHTVCEVLADVLQIIDKYKGERKTNEHHVR